MSLERVDSLIGHVMAKHLGESKKAQADYFEEVHQELAPLARALESKVDSLELQLRESRANDIAAMRWLTDCRFAVGDDGKRMLPEFVEYLKEIKRQRDELLAELSKAADYHRSHECYSEAKRLDKYIASAKGGV